MNLLLPLAFSGLLMIIGLLLFVFLVSLVIGSLRGAPFVPAGAKQVQNIVRLAQINPGERAIDLGSGEGRIVRALAGAGARAEGYEIQPLLVWWANGRSWWDARHRSEHDKALFGSAHSYRANLFKIDYRPYSVVTLYGFPSIMERLRLKFETELEPGSRVISLSFPIPGWQETRKVEGIYVYER